MNERSQRRALQRSLPLGRSADHLVRAQQQRLRYRVINKITSLTTESSAIVRLWRDLIAANDRLLLAERGQMRLIVPPIMRAEIQ